MRIMVTAAAKGAPAALQWRMSAPHGVRMSAEAVRLADGVAGLNKTLVCAEPQKPPADGAALQCLIAGGVHLLPNGPVAIVRLTAAEGAQSVSIQLDHIHGVTADAKGIEFADVRATSRLKSGARGKDR